MISCTINRDVLSVSAAVVACTALSLAQPQAHASLLFPDATQFAVLGQFSGNQTNFNNGIINGDVGMGSPRAFTICASTLRTSS